MDTMSYLPNSQLVLRTRILAFFGMAIWPFKNTQVPECIAPGVVCDLVGDISGSYCNRCLGKVVTERKLNDITF